MVIVLITGSLGCGKEDISQFLKSIFNFEVDKIPIEYISKDLDPSSLDLEPCKILIQNFFRFIS